MFSFLISINSKLFSKYIRILCLLFSLGLLSCAPEQLEESNISKISFNKDIRPILNKNCTGCHGGVTKQGGLSYVYRDETLGRGNSGRLNVVPGNAEASELYQRIISKDPTRRMPYKKPALPQREIDLLAQWINEGAKWEEHWAFVPPAVHAVPKHELWPKNNIDQFVLEKIKQQKLSPAPEAEPEQWLRRVSLDLTGLQPSVEEIENLHVALKNKTQDAVYAEIVEVLLASPAFGERWASMWMDLARYADSKGYERDRHREMWPYRDFLIDAFNGNMTYDEFIVKQLAGDLLPKPSFTDYAATAFSRLTSTNDEGGTDDEEYRMVAVMDRNATTWSVVNGLTMNCVQCHAHPYDPIPHEEYFSSLAFFNTSLDADDEADGPQLKFTDDASETAGLVNKQRQAYEIKQPLSSMAKQWVEADIWQDINLAQAHVNFNTAAALSVEHKSLEWQARPQDEKDQISWCRERELAKKEKREAPKKTNDAINEEYCNTTFWTTKWWYIGFQNSIKHAQELKLNPKEHTALALDNGRYNNSTPDLPPAGDYQFTSVKIEQDQRVQAFKFSVIPFDAAKSLHTPQDGFNIDRIGIEVIDENGGVRSLAIRSFYPDSPYGAGMLLNVKAKHKNDSIALPAEWYTGFASRQMFHPVSTVALLDAPVALKKGEQLRFSMGQFQINLNRDGKPYYFRNLAVFATDKVDVDIAEYHALHDEALQLLAEVERVDGLTMPVMLEQFTHEYRSTPLFDRGNYMTKTGPDIPPGTPAIFPELEANSARANRLDLARWFVSDAHPLTARVAVNRFWEQMFGQGLVLTLEDFGGAGALPSHPELLDWLALYFQQDLDWDIKRLLKEIAVSATYRQSAKVGSEKIAQDPDNTWLARGPRQRLTAEMVRDQALKAAGLLSSKMHGPSVMPPQPEGVWQQIGLTKNWETSAGEDQYRRAVYTYIKRSALYPSFQAFDDTGHLVSSPRRVPTNTPLQALVTLNDPVYFEAATALATILKQVAHNDSLAAAFDQGLKRVISRSATAAEQDIFLAAYEQALALNTQGDDAELHAWVDVAVAMLNMHASLVR